ncbi:hypothetical protein PR048_018289 [Dryococelus australis]|uniref:Integrase catalytic domain-containing protein n=1 Tax=Dryococelus australis TaxID=614101 RepID=A0ABQ9HBW2_9NEOP|nr:hypothetical protein PR048_018289 [Dryococelus australis]
MQCLPSPFAPQSLIVEALGTSMSCQCIVAAFCGGRKKLFNKQHKNTYYTHCIICIRTFTACSSKGTNSSMGLDKEALVTTPHGHCQASARAILRCLFATHGLPDTLVSDNGSTFNSVFLQEFAMNNNI